MLNSALRTNLEIVRPSPSIEILLLEFSLVSSDFLICYTFFRLAIILYDWGWNQGLTLFIRAPYRIERLFPVFKLLSLFCLDCILYDVGHKNPGMPLCSLNPYRSVQCYSWGTLWLFHGDNVSAFCVPTVLPCTLRREVFHIWLADLGILWVPLCSIVFCYWRVNIYILVGRLMA